MTQTDKKEFGMPFRQLPMELRRRWWDTTCYGKYPATDELMLTIEAINPDAAAYLAARDKERRDKARQWLADRIKRQPTEDEIDMAWNEFHLAEQGKERL